jgi:signal transduction histidine kinase
VFVLGVLPHSRTIGWTTRILAIDLAMFAFMLAFTKGPTSPVLAFFIFSLVYANLHWGWRGTVWTTVVAMSVFVVIGIDVARDPAFDLQRFAVHGAYMICIASLVGYVGAHDRRAHREIASLAGWSPMAAGEPQALLRDVLGRCAGVLHTSRLAVIWEQGGEPSTNIAVWHAGAFTWTREPSNLFESLEPPPAVPREPSNMGEPSPDVLADAQVRSGGWHYRPLPRLLGERFGAHSASTWSIRGQGIAGSLLCLDKQGLALDDVELGGIAARLVTATLEHFHLIARLREAVATEEQIRLARNLHDSVLQSLAGIAMQLHTARIMFETEPVAANTRLRDIQEALASEQRRLRKFIVSLRPFPISDHAVDGALAPSLADLCDRVERQWGVQARFRASIPDTVAIAPAQQEILRLVSEALVNAARHAQASLVTVDLAVHDGCVRVEVSDDGHGFPFTGKFDLAALNEMGVGPHSLKERVTTLGGELMLDSSPQGVRLIVTIPLDRPRQSSTPSPPQEDRPLSPPSGWPRFPSG